MKGAYNVKVCDQLHVPADLPQSKEDKIDFLKP